MPASRFPAPAPRRGKNADSATESTASDRPAPAKSLKYQKSKPTRDRRTRRDGEEGPAHGTGRKAGQDSPAGRARTEGGTAASRPGRGTRPARKHGRDSDAFPAPAPSFRDDPEQDERDQRSPIDGARASGESRDSASGMPGEADAFLQPGIKPVTELLQRTPEKIDTVFVLKGRKGRETSLILDLCRENGVRFSLVDEASLDRLWHGRHQGVIARLFATGFTDYAALLALAPGEPLPLIVALDQVQDPGNAGALARTLYALGGAGLLVPRHNGVYLGAAAARVAAGALDKLPVAKAANLAQALDQALDAGYAVYGAEAAPQATGATGAAVETVFAFTPRLPAVLVLGGEDGGIRPVIRKRCSAFLSIPFAREFDSLNVAQAGAVIIGAFAAAMRRSG